MGLTVKLHSAFLILIYLAAGARSGFPTEPNYHRVAYDNCGVPDEQTHVHEGANYTYPAEGISVQTVAANDPARTVAFHANQVVLRYEGLLVKAAYRLALTLLSDGPRCQTIYIGETPIESKLALQPGHIYKLTYDIPQVVYANGCLDVRIVRESGPNAVVSEAVLYSTARQLKPVLKLSARGDLNRRVVGCLVDINNGAPVANAQVVVRVGDQEGHFRTHTDEDGTFRVTVPRKWRQAILARGLRVRVTHASAVLQQAIEGLELFGPQLIPRPAHTVGVDQPILDLTGTWQFTPSLAVDFSGSIDKRADLANITVPGEWVMQGFEVAPGRAAGYVRAFHVPEDYQGKRVILHCDSVYALARVWINGHQTGMHAGGMTAFQFDITDQVRPGQTNTITMQVTNDTQADVLASGSQYAVHALGGITRKLYLMAVPRTTVSTLDVSTSFDAHYRDATLHINLAVDHTDAGVFKDGQVLFSLYDGNGHRVKLSRNRVALPPVTLGKRVHRSVQLPVPQPKQWDPEHPHLYELEATLCADTRVLGRVRRRVGFRQIEVRGQEVFVNNHPITLRGVNRHEVHPLRGRSLTGQQWRRDAELFRAANVNYIRTSHYPPAEEFLDACDELGLFVECEAPLCWVQHGANANWGKPEWNYLDPTLYVPLLRANLENVAFNRHHPSIIIWSLANESRWSPLWAKVLQAVEQYDPTRPTAFHDQSYGGYNNAGSQARIANMHYPGPHGPEQAATLKRPLLFGEYCHLNTYNRYELTTDPGLRDAWARGFKRMWDAIYCTPGCLGGALWSGIDDTFHLPSGQTVGYGAWGPIDGWRRPKPEYYHVKKVYSPVRVTRARLALPVEGTVLDIPLENRHDFTNLQELTIRWDIDGRSGTVSADIPAHGQGVLCIDTGLTNLLGRLLDLQFVSPRGCVIDEYRLPVGPAECAGAGHALEEKGTAPRVTRHGDTVVIDVNDCTYTIDMQTGRIVSGKHRGVTVLTGGPDLMILPLNRAGGTQMTKETQDFPPFTECCSQRTVTGVRVLQEKGQAVVEVEDQYTEAKGAYRLQINGQGVLRITYTYDILKDVTPRQWGLIVDVSDQCDALQWQRAGLWTVYPPDHIGRLQGQARALTDRPLSGPLGPCTQPDWPWSQDNSAWGTHDFRSTKETILNACLVNEQGRGLSILSDSGQHVRAWVGEHAIHWLIAEYSNAGAEGFFRSHAAVEDKPLKVGDNISGVIHLQLK
jgi:beta-galactosidase